VIRALPELRARLGDVVYVIVGEGDQGPLRAEAEALHVTPHVVFAGCVQDEQLPRLYALGDVFVMVSSEHRERADVEGFGMVYLEASACARPVVGGDTGGVGDAIQHGTTGLLVDPDDTVALQGAIGRLLQDRALAAAMGDAGRRRVEREFDWSVIASRLNEVVREVAG
jgi:phosphatidylinositol alpha-1,6-mannosyltransferase